MAPFFLGINPVPTRRHVGLLTVEVLEARGLKKYDILGKSDPFIELSTQPLTKEKTSVKKKTLTPHWNETKHVLVQVRPAPTMPCLCTPGPQCLQHCTGGEEDSHMQMKPTLTRGAKLPHRSPAPSSCGWRCTIMTCSSPRCGVQPCCAFTQKRSVSSVDAARR
jgi:C2 domain